MGSCMFYKNKSISCEVLLISYALGVTSSSRTSFIYGLLMYQLIKEENALSTGLHLLKHGNDSPA
jgi:hypothetical protein